MAYVGSGEDVRRIRRQEEKRQKEKEQFEAKKRQSDANIGGAGLRQFETGAGEVRFSRPALPLQRIRGWWSRLSTLEKAADSFFVKGSAGARPSLQG